MCTSPVEKASFSVLLVEYMGILGETGTGGCGKCLLLKLEKLITPHTHCLKSRSKMGKKVSAVILVEDRFAHVG